MDFPETNSSYNSEATTASTADTSSASTASAGAGELVKVGQKENPYIFAPDTYDWTSAPSFSSFISS